MVIIISVAIIDVRAKILSGYLTNRCNRKFDLEGSRSLFYGILLLDVTRL